MSNLEHLNLISTKVSDKGLLHLKDMKRLQWLDLGCSEVTARSLAFLQTLPLTTLELSGPKVTDEGLQHIKDMNKLQILKLTYTKITDWGMAQLK
jgi:hypothetical protein